MYIHGEKYKDLKAVFDKLAAGGDKTLRDMPFGTYGHLADKYEIHWFFQGEKSEA